MKRMKTQIGYTVVDEHGRNLYPLHPFWGRASAAARSGLRRGWRVARVEIREVPPKRRKRKPSHTCPEVLPRDVYD